ncbi:cell division protein FtsL [Rhizosaccharibacter radicis]|uniref:ABC transporter permease n=1 Tax=Rhizosaccharibacter radicis TaxID=2782605 RepID=A0ABT1VY41_9PROT|nr:ABC transporter permease [Acetobacteraceae bacterium KSS12]
MIRSFTLVCALMAGGSGLYLYSEKHRTTLLDQQISRIVSDTEHTRERTAMLRAEWALLNQPDRLQGLATRFLPKLQPMTPGQFVQLASLGERLPPVASEAPAPARPTPVPAEAPVVAQPASEAAPAAMAMAGGAQHRAAAPTAIAAASPAPATEAARRFHAPTPPVQLADADADDRSGMTDAEPVATVRTVSARAVVRPAPTPAAHAVRTRVAARTTPATASSSVPAVRTVSATSYRPAPIAAAVWRPARPSGSWSSPHAATAPNGGVTSALGSSSYGHPALAAPVPVSDGG